ncbi:MAG TPA: hypothetical protein VI336_00905 [Candidatus Saccharimonadales bacterium]|nr:hypothetical protein [Candidatus Saccharimonadales bacterium]
MSLRQRIAVLMTIVVSSLVLVSAALAGSWTLNAANGTYSGDCNVGSDGSLNCHGQLVSGSPESSSAVVIQSGNCTLVLTPSGNANMNCKKQ